MTSYDNQKIAIHLNMTNIKTSKVNSESNQTKNKRKTFRTNVNLDKECYHILDSYFTQYDGKELIKHQLDSYNDFMENKIPDIISQVNPLKIYHEKSEQHNKYKYEIQIRFKDHMFTEAIITENDGSTSLMTPNEARLRNFTYSMPLNINVEVTTIERYGDDLEKESKTVKFLPNINIGKIPIMVKSNFCILSNDKTQTYEELGECKYDPGGYFIVNGNEKSIVAQEKIADNKPYTFKVNKINNKTICMAEIKSVSEKMFSIPKNFSLKLIRKGHSQLIRATINNIKQDVPLFILFKALGVESDRSILKYIINDLGSHNNKIIYCLEDTINEAKECNTQSDAYEYIMRYINTYGQPKDIVLVHMKRRKDILRNC